MSEALSHSTLPAGDAALAAAQRWLSPVFDGAVAQDMAQYLIAEQTRRGVIVHGKPLCKVLRPRFIGSEALESLADASRKVSAILERAAEGLRMSEELMPEVGASEEERKIWEIDPGYPGYSVTSRLDSFLDADGPKFVEYNAESPAGIAFTDVLAEIFRNSKMRVVDEDLQTFDARGRLLDTILWAYGNWGGRDRPSIAIIDWQDVVTRRDFELCADYFRQRGLEAVICDPRRIEYHQGKVWYGSQRVTVIYRRVLLHELLEKAWDVRPLMRAYAEGAICIVNSPRSKLLHKKTVFALLSEGRLPIKLSDEERDVVAKTIPWTRTVRTGETEYRGEKVELANLLLMNRESFALKPADDYGGRGIVLGWATADAEWEQAVEQAFGGGYVVQERVNVPFEEFPVWNDDGVEMVPMMLDTDPLLFRGELGGILTRLATDPLLNVTAGTGSTAPTFVAGEGP